MADRTLVFVAGASPQIITETAYTLLSSTMPVTDVYVLTTLAGRNAIEANLFGEKAAWTSFLREHRCGKRYRFSPDQVIVLHGRGRRPLADVRSAEDSAAVSDQIARFVAEHTRDGDAPLHASIAGGRKTMGYLLGAALMLYGRAEDRLSHVLIHPPELEGTDFYFPPRTISSRLEHRGQDGAVLRVAGTDLRIELVDLPFPRLRGLKQMRELPPRRFSELVAELQQSLDGLARPRLVVQRKEERLVCGGKEVELPPLRVELYALLAERRERGCERPGCPGCAGCFLAASDVTGRFRDELSRRMRARESAGVEPRRWGLANFRPEVSRINDTLRKQLHGASEAYEITIRGPKRERLYGISLPRDVIVTDAA